MVLRLLDDREHVASVEDEQVFAGRADLGAAVLRVDDDVADADVHWDDLAGLVGTLARASGEDFTLLGLLLGGVGDDQTACGCRLRARSDGPRCGPRVAAGSFTPPMASCRYIV